MPRGSEAPSGGSAGGEQGAECGGPDPCRSASRSPSQTATWLAVRTGLPRRSSSSGTYAAVCSACPGGAPPRRPGGHPPGHGQLPLPSPRCRTSAAVMMPPPGSRPPRRPPPPGSPRSSPATSSDRSRRPRPGWRRAHVPRGRRRRTCWTRAVPRPWPGARPARARRPSRRRSCRSCRPRPRASAPASRSSSTPAAQPLGRAHFQERVDPVGVLADVGVDERQSDVAVESMLDAAGSRPRRSGPGREVLRSSCPPFRWNGASGKSVPTRRAGPVDVLHLLDRFHPLHLRDAGVSLISEIS